MAELVQVYLKQYQNFVPPIIFYLGAALLLLPQGVHISDFIPQQVAVLDKQKEKFDLHLR